MPTSPYTGRFVVRLTESVAAKIARRAQSLTLADWETLQDLAEDFELTGLSTLFSKYPKHPTRRAITGATNAEILNREKEQATSTDFPPLHSLTAYFIVDSRVWKNRAKSRRYLKDLGKAPEVDLVYEEATLRPPKSWVVDPSDPLVQYQGYLNAAPQGVGANTVEVWGSYGGGGVAFVDVESGWNLNHVDLPTPSHGRKPIVNINDPIDADHGTAVLGIVLAQVNQAGITGLAPAAKFIGVSSWLVSATKDPDIVGAIYEAARQLGKGDVLLIEVETALGYPVEVEQLTFDQIRNASGSHVIVIEPAGNGTGTVGRDLDKPPVGSKGGTKARTVSRTSDDSGAILVSACRSSTTTSGLHRRKGFAGYGSRVNCYAWGENVATAGSGGLGSTNGKNNNYTDTFDGTSAAAAIIAGAALLAQDMSQHKSAHTLLPKEMRALLSDPQNGTAILAPSGNKKMSGIMPDLRAISKKV
jgi:Subtilase family